MATSSTINSHSIKVELKCQRTVSALVLAQQHLLSNNVLYCIWILLLSLKGQMCNLLPQVLHIFVWNPFNLGILQHLTASPFYLPGQADQPEFPEAVQSGPSHQAPAAGLHYPHPALDLCSVFQSEETHSSLSIQACVSLEIRVSEDALCNRDFNRSIYSWKNHTILHKMHKEGSHCYTMQNPSVTVQIKLNSSQLKAVWIFTQCWFAL